MVLYIEKRIQRHAMVDTSQRISYSNSHC